MSGVLPHLHSTAGGFRITIPCPILLQPQALLDVTHKLCTPYKGQGAIALYTASHNPRLPA